MISEGKEAYDLLTAVAQMPAEQWSVGYKLMRDLLERLCRSQMQNDHLQMTDLSARISFVSSKLELTVVEQNRLHTFRLTSNAVLNFREEPVGDKLLRDVKTLTFFVQRLFKEQIPAALRRFLPQSDATYLVPLPRGKKMKRLRACFLHADETYLYVRSLDFMADELLKVRYNLPDINQEFTESCRVLWPHAQINLLDVIVGEDLILTPGMIVLEPDYLIDISTLSECYKDYGHSSGNYFISRLLPIENARPLLLGNMVNLFLDEWIYAEQEPDYMTCMQKAFKRYPIELAACSDLKDREKERQFFDDCKLHFEHLREVVTDTFTTAGYDLNKKDAVLEPSYVCEALGLQGRLDYMQRDMTAFIEMKSGRADEYLIRGKVEPKENNRVQMLLYQAVLEYSMGMDHHKVKPFLLYTRYPLLYPARASWAMLRRVINLRNTIVAEEYRLQSENNVDYTTNLFKRLNADVLNQKGLKGRFWEVYLRPSIDAFQEKMTGLSDIERRYVSALYNFISKELYVSKTGDSDYEGRVGAAGLWLSSLTDKLESGEIICNLRMIENRASDLHKASLTFERELPDGGATAGTLPNFREGDAVVLYQWEQPTDNVTNRLIFKGNIESLDEEKIVVRLRASQRNKAVLPQDKCYAIEHDIMDTTFRMMYQGIHAFMSASPARRALWLGLREATFDRTFDEWIEKEKDGFTKIALKARAAKDYFLLIGPPGTGKTSCALKRMVELFYAEKQAQILLLSYTNRAVDEICKMLVKIEPKIDFIRIGSELSCEVAYRDYLIENVLGDCRRRREVAGQIERCRVIVGTVASIAAKPELFRLKHFDVAIIDEATQILEPQLLPIFCAKDEEGREAIDQFILIGDHKQLPAVVLQREEDSMVNDPLLREVGLTNLNNSLFERLYHAIRSEKESSLALVMNDGTSRGYEMLCNQGRMHPEVAQFPNQMFYGGQLKPVGLPHQMEKRTSIRRLAFFPSTAESIEASAKTNHSEAKIVAQLALDIFQTSGDSFNAMQTLGVITPYRSQIALIKKEIESLNVSGLKNILVDTVERFQGSERDVIIYSFCLNHPYQLRLLSNLTEEDGVSIDRKLNVALTRARKQLLLTGVPELLNLNPIYRKLIEFVAEYQHK